MAKQKKEKQIPIKQQMYEQMITSQLYGDQPTQEEKIQKSYDEWKANKDTTARIQERYDAWLAEKNKTKEPQEPSQPIEATTTPKSETKTEKKKVKAPAKKENEIYKTHADVLAGLKRAPETKQEPKKKEQKRYLTHQDVMPKLTKRSVDVTNNSEAVKKASNEAKSISKIAKQLGISEDEVKQRMTAPKEELNSYDAKKIDKDTTAKLQAASAENARKRAQKKFNPWETFTGRFAKATTDIVNAPVAIAGKLAGKDLSIYNDALKQEFKDAKEQHPVASTLGDLSGMTFAAYALGGGSVGTKATEGTANAGQVFNALKDEALLNGASKKVATAQALKGAFPTLAANAASNMPTDFAVDVIPTLANDIAEGEKTKGEIIRDTLLNTGINYGFNTIGDAISLGRAMKNIPNPASGGTAFKTLDADEIAQLNTNPLEADNKQFTELMNEFNGKFKDESAMKNIFTPEDLDASQNRQLAELMDEYRARSAVNDLAGNVAEPVSKNAIPELRGPAEAIGETANAINPTPSTLKLSDEVWDKLDSRFTEIAELTNKVQRSKIMDTVTDEKALKEWAAVNEAYSNYLNKAMFDGTIEETEAAKKALDAARKRYSRAMKDINPEIAKEFNSGTYGKQIGRPVYDRNVKNFEDSSQEATDLINTLENTESAAKNFPNTTKPAAKTQQITIENEKEFRKDINSLKASFRAKTRWIKDADNKFAKKFIQSADDFLKKPSTENYEKLIKDHNNYIANAKPNAVMTNWHGTKYKPQYRPEEITSALDNLAKKYGKENFADVKSEKPIYVDATGKRPYAKNQGVSPSIENEAKRIDEWIEEQGLEDELSPVEQSIDNVTRNVPGADRLQFFGGDNNAEWKTSKFRTNTMENTGWLKDENDLPMKDYAYRVFTEEEQKAAASERFKESQNVVNDLMSTDRFDEVDVKAAMNEMQRLLDDGSADSLRQARRLGEKSSHEARESGRTVQALAEYNKNTASGALNDAFSLQDENVSKWRTKNKKKVEGNSRIAKALSDMGNKWRKAVDAPELTHEQIKAGVKAELDRELGSSAQYFNDNDLEYLTILAENKNIPVWQITDEIEHKLNFGDWYTLDESIPQKMPTNTKLNNALNSLIEGNVRAEKATPSLEQITDEVRNTISKESAAFAKQFSDEDIDYLANLINNGAAKSELAEALDLKLSTGTFGISDEAMQNINNIFKEISKYDVNSKQFVEGQAEAYRILADELNPKATALEKFDSWRYLAMLGNPKTMLRNYIGNQTFNIVTGISNNLSAIGEAGIDKAIKAFGGEGIQRTKSVLNPVQDAGLIKAAEIDADASRYRQLVGSKYEKMDKNAIKRAKSVFDSKLLQLYEKATDKGISDYSAAKRKYSTSLAGYLKANGYDSTIFDAETELARLKNKGKVQLLSNAENEAVERLAKEVETLEKGRDFALKQAEYATFHEDNAVADLLTKWSKDARSSDSKVANAMGIMIEGTVPFKKTPANILRSGVEYSPIGAIDSLRKTGKLVYENTGKRAGNLSDVYVNSKGKEITKTLAADVIDSWAKTLTGTGLTVLGIYLYNKGALRVSDPDTKYQDQLEGIQNYSIEINGKTYTLDWAVPSAMPLFLGAEIAKVNQALGKTDAETYESIDDYMALANRLAEPMVETSMLQGVKDTLETAASTAAYDGTVSVPTTLAYNMATGYATQAIPTLSGQIARTVDNTRRSTYSDKNSAAERTIDKQGKKIVNKIPWVSKLNEPYVDTYGREQKNSPSDNLGINLAYQMLSPGFYSKINTTDADKLSREVYEYNKTESVLPKYQTSFKDAEGNRVSPKDFTTASKAYGKANKEIRDALSKDDWFKKLDKEGKEEIVKGINTISEHVGKAAIDSEYATTSKAYNIYKQNGMQGLMDYYKKENAKDVAKQSGFSSTSNASKAIQKDVQDGDMKAAEQKIDAATQIKSLGLDKPGPTYTYYNAQKTIPDLTPEKFASTYKSIDADGNQGIKQDEIINYLNNHNISESEGKKIWSAYGNSTWKSIPTLKDGKWSKSRK